jgi:hypothetical protein
VRAAECMSRRLSSTAGDMQLRPPIRQVLGSFTKYEGVLAFDVLRDGRE